MKLRLKAMMKMLGWDCEGASLISTILALVTHDGMFSNLAVFYVALAAAILISFWKWDREDYAPGFWNDYFSKPLYKTLEEFQ